MPFFKKSPHPPSAPHAISLRSVNSRPTTLPTPSSKPPSLILEKLQFSLKKFQRRHLATDNLALIIIMIFCFAWLWGSVSAMSRNWELARRVEERKRERALLALEVETLALENQYFKSSEYQELAARRQHGKILDGETLLLLPPNSPAAINKYRPPKPTPPPSLSNFEQWLTFLLGWENLKGLL